MKNFSKFLEEITIKGNSGVPSDQYLKDIETSSKARLGVTRDPWQMQAGRTGQEMMSIVERSMRLSRGKEKELEELAETIIRQQYEAILDNVELDIKLLRSGKQVKDFMDEEEEEDEEPEQPSARLLNDPEIRKHVDKAKLLNNVIQGEAKNTKNILQLPEVLEALVTIFGQANATELHGLWARISALADKMDWIIPFDVKADMMERQPEGMAGAVKVDWKPKEKKEKEEEDPEDQINKILKSLEDGDDLEDNEEEIAEVFSEGTPIIKARGIDFPMLLHETVKGIYELIAAASLPAEDASEEEKRIAKIAKDNTTSFDDEAEDFQYGPVIAARLRDFVNESPNSDRYPNMRELVFGKMSAMDPDTFLNLMKGILSGTDVARTEVDSLVNEVLSEVEEYAKQLSKWELGEILGHDNDEDDSSEQEEDREEDSEFADPDKEESDEDKLIRQSSEKPKEDESDYSTWTQRELQDAIDQALDTGKYDIVRKLSTFLKEGKIYLNELERINENVNPHHTKRRRK